MLLPVLVSYDSIGKVSLLTVYLFKEILYQVNYIHLLTNNPELIDIWIKSVDQEIEKHSNDFGMILHLANLKLPC